MAETNVLTSFERSHIPLLVGSRRNLGCATGVCASWRAHTSTPGDGASSAPKNVSKSGIPYRPDGDEAGPPELVNVIRARRPDGKLWNLDRMLLHSPAFAQGWNAMFGAIRGKLSLPPKLRELAIMSVAVLNRADY